MTDDGGDTGHRRRLDVELVRRGLCRSRSAATTLVNAGDVLVDGVRALKPAQAVSEATVIRITGEQSAWVGRAAHKLDAALDLWAPEGLSVADRRCLDVGASTGGFTQVLLSRGARSVLALDVGHGQLAEEVRSDPRVSDRPGVNIRNVEPGELGAPFDVVVVDVSFISLTMVVPRLPALLTPAADVVVLVKPQFEVGREALGARGVVRSVRSRHDAVERVLHAAQEAGFATRGLTPSPITGEFGNVEYLAWLAHRLGTRAEPGTTTHT